MVAKLEQNVNKEGEIGPRLAPARRRCTGENIMKTRTERRKLTDELRREYDLSKLKGVRGKYAGFWEQSRALVTGRR